jgi:hypothetical protein
MHGSPSDVQNGKILEFLECSGSLDLWQIVLLIQNLLLLSVAECMDIVHHKNLKLSGYHDAL